MPLKTPEQNTRRSKHAELTRTLRELVATLQPGQLFPSQAELISRYKVSDSTVLRSLEDLRRDGWIVRRHGVGTFVADPTQRHPTTLTRQAKETQTIAALTTSFISFYKHCVDLLTVQSEAAGFSLVCHYTQNPSSFDDALPLEMLKPRGFILFGYALMPVARQLLERGHRAVIMGAPPADTYPVVPTVYGDHEYGGQRATRHLLELGHRRIAFACNSDDMPNSLQRRLRWRGHLAALSEAEKEGSATSSSVIGPDLFAAWGQNPSQARDFLLAPDGPTGIAVWNDTEAAQLLRILHSAGVRVPEDVSVIGYDNLPESQETLPLLTTMDQHIDKQLQTVLDLTSRADPPPPTQSFVILPTLVNRASCAPPSSARKDIL